jgi:hypothetical protein
MIKVSKESFKQLLEAGVTLQFPYKTKISSWYGELKAYKQYDGFYHVDHTRFSDIDQAVDFFITEAFTSKNVGYIQSRLMNKNLLGEYDLEKPTSKIKNLFQEEGKVVDEESKVWNLRPIVFPKAKDAVSEFNKLVKLLTPENIKSSLGDFEKKYATLDPYISISYKYDIEGVDHGYRITFEYEDFSIEGLNEAKNRSDLPQHKMTWNCLHISFRVKGDNGNFHFFDLNF